MALEPGDQLGDKFYCRGYSAEDIKAGKADYLIAQETGSNNNIADPYDSEAKSLMGLYINDVDEGITSVYLSESQVDDLIVTLLYWKENH